VTLQWHRNRFQILNNAARAGFMTLDEKDRPYRDANRNQWGTLATSMGAVCVVTNDQERIFIEAVRAIADACTDEEFNRWIGK
jgi:predicted nucleic acid-binding protein